MTENVYLQTVFAQTETEELVSKIKHGLTTEALEIAITELASRGYPDGELARLRAAAAEGDDFYSHKPGMPSWGQKVILVFGGLLLAMVISAPLKGSIPASLIKLPVIVAVAYFWRKIDQEEREMEASKNKTDALNFQLTPLMLAAANGNLNDLRMILESGVDPNEANRDGATALMFAVKNRENKAVNLLIKAGADPMLKTNKGKSALDFATKSQRSEIQKAMSS